MNYSRYVRFVLVLSLCTAGLAQAADIHGTGATFPSPLYDKWASAYKKATGITIHYESLGSGAGIRQIKTRAVDFGASDMPLGAVELDSHGLIQFPAIIGGVVPIVNIEGLRPGQIRLTGQLLGEIYLGRIAKWNAPEIAALNPGVKLPNADITVTYRTDGSGTSFLFSEYLSKKNAAFKSIVGNGVVVKWPVGVGGKGNEGVAANVRRIAGAIGYVEYAYAKQNKMQHVSLLNRDGEFVDPSAETFAAAARGAKWTETPGFDVVLTDQSGKKSWPITGASFILIHRTKINVAKTRSVLAFFDWAYKNGGDLASELDYVPIPDPVVTQVKEYWKLRVKDDSGKSIW